MNELRPTDRSTRRVLDVIIFQLKSAPLTLGGSTFSFVRRSEPDVFQEEWDTSHAAGPERDWPTREELREVFANLAHAGGGEAEAMCRWLAATPSRHYKDLTPLALAEFITEQEPGLVARRLTGPALLDRATELAATMVRCGQSHLGDRVDGVHERLAFEDGHYVCEVDPLEPSVVKSVSRFDNEGDFRAFLVAHRWLHLVQGRLRSRGNFLLFLRDWLRSNEDAYSFGELLRIPREARRARAERRRQALATRRHWETLTDCPSCKSRAFVRNVATTVLRGSIEYPHFFFDTEVEYRLVCDVCKSEWSDRRIL